MEMSILPPSFKNTPLVPEIGWRLEPVLGEIQPEFDDFRFIRLKNAPGFARGFFKA